MKHLYAATLNRLKLEPNSLGHVTRQKIRSKEILGPTAGLAPGFLQANLIVLPNKSVAFDFMTFCLHNSQALPLLEVVNSYSPSLLAKGADLRTDLPAYYVFLGGKEKKIESNITKYWTSESVAFLLGCSFTFETELRVKNLLKPFPTVPMFVTSRLNVPSGPFGGNLVVSYRKIKKQDLARVIKITGHHRISHGAPVYWGNDYEKELGIKNLNEPDFGVKYEEGLNEGVEIPIFHACGVTAQVALENAASSGLLPYPFITHAPGNMFVSDAVVA